MSGSFELSELTDSQRQHRVMMTETREDMHSVFRRTIPEYDEKLRDVIDRFIDYPGAHEYELRSIYTGRIETYERPEWG